MFVNRVLAKKLFAIIYSGLFFLLWGFSTIFYQYPLTKVFYAFITILIIACGFILKKIILGFSIELKKEVLSIILFISIIYGVMSTAGVYELFFTKRDGYVIIAISNILCFLSFISLAFALISNLNVKLVNIFSEVYDKLRGNIYFFFLVLAIVALSFDSCQTQIKWDGMIYFNHTMNSDMYSLSSIGVVGHLTQGYALIVSIARLVLVNSGLTILAVNICLLLYSTVCFYRLIIGIFPKIKRATAVLLTGIYAFSPFLLGMVNYYSPDYMFTCLLIPLVYYSFRKNWGIFSIISFFFVFSKEPAVFAYFGICLGVLIIDYIETKSIKKIISSAKYYYMLAIGLLWGLMYFFLGAWVSSNSGENAFKPGGQYIIDKLKVMYVLNNNWIFVLLAITGLFVAQKKIIRFLIPVICGTMLFTGMSVAFVTMNHPRYAAISTPVLLLCGVICWGDYLTRHKKEILLILCATIASIIMIISCFVTIDPLSKSVFKTINIGNATLITTGSEKVGDFIVYNKQALWLERVVNEAIEYGLKNNASIVFPGNEGAFYSYDGMVETSVINDNGITVSEEFWNVKRKERNGVYSYGKQIKGLEIQRVDTISILPKGKYCYIQQPTDNSGLYDEIMENNLEFEERYFSYRGWIGKAVLFEIN